MNLNAAVGINRKERKEHRERRSGANLDHENLLLMGDRTLKEKTLQLPSFVFFAIFAVK